MNQTAKPKRRTSRSNSSAARINHASVNSDLSVIKGAKSSKPPSIITRKTEESTTMSRSPLYSQLHWMMNDMSPRNLSPRTASPSGSPRSYTPTKRGYDTFAYDNARTNEIAPVGTSSFVPSILQDDSNGVPFGRSVRQKRDEDPPFLSTSLPAQPLVQPNPNTFVAPFDKMLSPPSPSTYAQFPLFGGEHNVDLDVNGGSVHFESGENHNGFSLTSTPQKPHIVMQANSQFSFALPEFKLNTDSSMVLSEPSMFDFDTL